MSIQEGYKGISIGPGGGWHGGAPVEMLPLTAPMTQVQS